MKPELVQTVASVTFLLLLIFTVFLLQYKKGNKLSHKLLAAFLLVNSIYIFTYITLTFRNIFLLDWTAYLDYGFTIAYFFGPTLLFYTKSVSSKVFKLTPIDALHVLPFILGELYLVIFNNGDFLYYFIMNTQILIYLIVCLKELRKYEVKIRSYYSSINLLSLSWLKIIVIAFFVMWLLDYTHLFMSEIISIPIEIHRLISFVSVTINFVFIIMLFFKGLQHPEVLSRISDEVFHTRYHSSRLSENEKLVIKNKLIDYLENDKPYLNPELTLNDLAEKTGIHSKSISQVINEALGKNFFDLINSYRIKDAQNILLNSDDSKKTVLEVLYEVGFNSKSVFNSAFKKQTGLTPTEFKRKYRISA